MAIPLVGSAAHLAHSAIMCRIGGMWRAIRAHIDGRNAIRLERERRATLLMVPLALPPGAEVDDLRADGSVLRLRVPAAPMGASLGGDTRRSAPRVALPVSGLQREGASDKQTGIVHARDE